MTLLQIFSHGTYSTYTSSPTPLPELTDAQKHKLRQLSLLTLASDKSNALTYPSLLKQLELSTTRELEELVISAIYAGLINAQLDPKNEVVQINSVAALRDVAPGAINGLLSSLQAWAGRCEATLHSLEAQMSSLRAAADMRAAEATAWASKMETMVESEQKGGLGPSSLHRDNQHHHTYRHDHNSLHNQHRHHYQSRQQGGMMSSSSLLTDGGGNSFSGLGSASAGNPVSSTALPTSSNATGLMKVPQRYGKRGSGQMDGSDSDVVDEETMDIDEEDNEDDGKKRASKRKM